MTAYAHFIRPRDVKSAAVQVLGAVRAREAVAAGSASTTTVEDGEIVIVVNGGTASILVAFGQSPDASGSGETQLSSAGYVLTPGATSPPFMPGTGARVGVESLD